MFKRTGHMLVCLSVILFSANMISNAIIMSGINDYELLWRAQKEFTTSNGYMLGGAFLIIGIACLIISVIREKK